MRATAIERPKWFAQKYILHKEQGSSERRTMAGMLKTLNPEYYEENRDILGEASDWEEFEEPFTLKDVDFEED